MCRALYVFSEKRGYEEAAKRLKLESEDRGKIIPHLRIESRRKYLEKRKEDKVAELEADILDDEYLFANEVLTEREKKERDHKKKLLQIAKDHERARDLEKVQRYHMPADSKNKGDEKYQEIDDRERVPNYEQRKWEEEQMSSAVFRFGAKDKRQKDKGQDYDLVLEGDEIEFIQALTIPGAKGDQKVSCRHLCAGLIYFNFLHSCVFYVLPKLIKGLININLL